jgi:hypothetical protein
MIKLNTAYSTKNGHYYIVIIRNPSSKCYELHRSCFLSYIRDFNYLLNECNPLFAFDKLSDVRYYARKIIDGEEF